VANPPSNLSACERTRSAHRSPDQHPQTTIHVSQLGVTAVRL